MPFANRARVHQDRLRELIRGYQVSQAIGVAASLGLADLLANGPRSADDLAQSTGAHRRSLLRLLRALTSVGVFRQDPESRFALAPLGQFLQADAPGSLRALAIHEGHPNEWTAWGDLRHSIMTGESAFRHVHGMDPWEYRATHPEVGRIFDAAMGSGSPAEAAAPYLSAYGFADMRCVVDVGGGRGTLLAGLLLARPTLRGILFDLPSVVEAATTRLGATGVLDRCAIVAGDFFAAVPDGGDVYVLQGVLHDWDDAAARRILVSCRRALDDGGRLLIADHVIDPDDPSQAGANSMDLHMLVVYGSGERTAADFAALLAAAGFRLTRVIPVQGSWSLIEAVPA
jgi:SAM-dependent methyltransferase